MTGHPPLPRSWRRGGRSFRKICSGRSRPTKSQRARGLELPNRLRRPQALHQTGTERGLEHSCDRISKAAAPIADRALRPAAIDAAPGTPVCVRSGPGHQSQILIPECTHAAGNPRYPVLTDGGSKLTKSERTRALELPNRLRRPQVLHQTDTEMTPRA
jgi:hypothetical protein